jgi:hypothetical protein
MKKILFFFYVVFLFNFSFSQEIYIPRDIKKAYDNGTRAKDGNPGPKYFQNRADYNIKASFYPETRLLKAYETIVYSNNSELPFRYAVIRLYQNIFKKGGIRGREVDPGDISDGVKITSLTIKGKKINLETDQWLLRESQTNIFIPFNCRTDSTAEIEVGWEFIMPSKPNDRFGGYDGKSFFMGYWFPQISVFDDINGWDTFDYDGVAEFYNEYGNFDVKITVPKNFVIWGTGTLQNPGEVLLPKYLQRFQEAMNSTETNHIITSDDRNNNDNISPQDTVTWHFMATNVNDFAFATSSTYLWDASGMTSRSGKKIILQSAYNPENQNFSKVVDVSRWNIEELEKNIVGVDYPYPSMTVFNGSGGMEYPMIVNDHDGTLIETIFVTSHEITHTYFPFLVGTNQRRHGWFDEGLVTMLGMEVHFTRDSTMNLRKSYTDFYPLVAGTQMDLPQMVNSTYLSDNVFQLHEYARSSLAFWTLRDFMGNDLFQKCIIEFIKRWEGKHPTPWDFFFTCNDVSGEDYSWFFEPWFNQFAYPDMAVKSAKYENESLEVVIQNAGGIPLPAKLEIKYQDGSNEVKIITGKQIGFSQEFKIAISTKKHPTEVHLDTSGYPDCNEGNNTFNLEKTHDKR